MILLTLFYKVIKFNEDVENSRRNDAEMNIMISRIDTVTMM